MLNTLSTRSSTYMQLSSRNWEASGLSCLVGQWVFSTGEREREMGGCMSFRRNGAENMKEVKPSENWKVKIAK